MKKLFIFLFGGLLCFNCKAQTEGITINYKVIHTVDTILKSKIVYNAQLAVRNNKSRFASFNKIYNDSLDDLLPKLQEEYKLTGQINISSPIAKHLSSQEFYEIYKDLQTNSLEEIRGIPAGDIYQLSDTLHNISWSIMPSTKRIIQYECQKAETYFKGRVWTVWFCKDIGISNGPWKFGGLPGIILEATDKLNNISFIAYEIKQECNLKVELASSIKNVSKITRKDFYKLLKAYADDPDGYAERLYNFHYDEIKLSDEMTISKEKRKLNLPNYPLEPFY